MCLCLGGRLGVAGRGKCNGVLYLEAHVVKVDRVRERKEGIRIRKSSHTYL
jgi:hypothetical protein